MPENQPDLNYPFTWTGPFKISVSAGVHRLPKGRVVDRELMGVPEDFPGVTVHSLRGAVDDEGFSTIERFTFPLTYATVPKGVSVENCTFERAGLPKRN